MKPSYLSSNAAGRQHQLPVVMALLALLFGVLPVLLATAAMAPPM